jgi:hypothetical protein
MPGPGAWCELGCPADEYALECHTDHDGPFSALPEGAPERCRGVAGVPGFMALCCPCEI